MVCQISIGALEDIYGEYGRLQVEVATLTGGAAMGKKFTQTVRIDRESRAKQTAKKMSSVY